MNEYFKQDHPGEHLDDWAIRADAHIGKQDARIAELEAERDRLRGIVGLMLAVHDRIVRELGGYKCDCYAGPRGFVCKWCQGRLAAEAAKKEAE